MYLLVCMCQRYRSCNVLRPPPEQRSCLAANVFRCAIRHVCLSVAIRHVCLSVAIRHVCLSVAIRHVCLSLSVLWMPCMLAGTFGGANAYHILPRK